jgi:hypothetical protein
MNEIELVETVSEVTETINNIVSEQLHQIHENPELGGKNYNKLNTEEEMEKYLQSVEDYAALVRYDIGTRFPEGAHSGTYFSMHEAMLEQAKMLRILARMLAR